MPADPDLDRPAAGDGQPAEPWWRGAVFYQIYPRSFADRDGDGVGDLAGIRAHLDHLAALGVDAIWLSPFYRSPMADFGYDVADHCDVDPVFGTLAEFDALLADAHARGIRVIVDFVPNHTSDRHAWFEASRSARDDPHRDWYLWRDPKPDGSPPNNWRASFTGETHWIRDDTGQLRPRFGLKPDDHVEASAWTLDERTGQCYLHVFLPEQPDVNWRNDELADAMLDVLRFWLDRGADGFRVDAISSVGKPDGLPDADEKLAMLPGGGLTDDAFVLDVIRRLRLVVDGYDDRMMVGEVGGIDVPTIMRHVGHDKFHLAFNFPPMYDRWRADRWRRHITETEHETRTGALWPAWVLSNHDAPRHADRYGSQARARAAAVLLLTLRGTAFLYMGEELGLIDADIPPERRVDPGGRDGARAPLPWTDDPAHGWAADPWLPFPRNAATHNVERLAADPHSILHLYRALLAARRASRALRVGDFAWPPSPHNVLAFRRWCTTELHGEGNPTDPTDERVVIVNVDGTPAHVDAPAGRRWRVEIDSTMVRAGERWTGALGGDEAVVLAPE
jgi:alpha-glucosidase